eukprot:UN0498
MHWQPNRTWASADSRSSDCAKWRDAADCALPKQLWRTPKGRGDRGRGHLRNKTSHPLHPTLASITGKQRPVKSKRTGANKAVHRKLKASPLRVGMEPRGAHGYLNFRPSLSAATSSMIC